jgi:Arc/MetJ-type ribon-helix-helix transcriptional regulator
MRNIINISLPQALKDEVDNAMKSGEYASRSDFFRDLIRSWKEMKLLSELRESQKDFENGKYKVLNSLKDLD